MRGLLPRSLSVGGSEAKMAFHLMQRTMIRAVPKADKVTHHHSSVQEFSRSKNY